MNILELFAHIGLKADQGPADLFLKTVKGIQGELVGAIAGTLSLAGAIKMVNNAMGDALEFKKFSADTGESAEQLQKWKAVADEVSGSGDTVAASLRAISSNQERIKLGQGNISGYQLLGIDPRSDPMKVLEQLRGKLQGLSPGMKRNIAAQFGVSNDLVMTLELTNKEFDRLAARAWVIPQSSIDGLNRARASLSEVKNALTYFQAELATKLAPTIQAATKWVIQFALMIERAVIMFDKMVRASIGWKNALIAIAAVMVALNASFLTSPIGLFTMAILLLMGVLEDLYVYSTGGKSAFGHLMKDYPKFAETMKTLSGYFRDISGAIKALFSGDLGKFDEIVSKWGVFGIILKGVADSFKLIQSAVYGILTGDWSQFLDVSGLKEGIDKIKGDIKDLKGGKGPSIGEIFQGMGSGFMELLNDFKNSPEVRAFIPQAAGAGGPVAVTNNIYGVEHPEEAGRAASKATQDALKKQQAQQTRNKRED